MSTNSRNLATVDPTESARSGTVAAGTVAMMDREEVDKLVVLGAEVVVLGAEVDKLVVL